MCYVCMLDPMPTMLTPSGCLGSCVDKSSARVGLPFELSMQGASEADIARLVGSLGVHIEQLHSADLATARSCKLLGACVLPPAVCQLTQLTALKVDECSSLTRLPDSVGNLAQLQELWLWGCSSLAQLPDSIGQLAQLTDLWLDDCSGLAQLPDSIGQLAQLQVLRLWGCSSLAQLPDSIGQLAQLTGLRLQGCSSLAQLPDSIGQLTRLQNLWLSGCSSLAQLPEAISALVKLQYLDLSLCESLAFPAGLLKLRAPGCRVIVQGSGFMRDYDHSEKERSVQPLKRFQNMVRRHNAMRSLLGDRDARRASLDSISVVAGLLATAAFVAFASAPGLPDAFDSK